MLDLKNAAPEQIAEALMAMDKERPGLAYDVGFSLIQKGASKEFPGPSPWNMNVKSPNHGRVIARSFDPARRADVIAGYRILRNNPIPTYDENDPKWLKATRAERRAAKRAVEAWSSNPNCDGVPLFLSYLEREPEPGMRSGIVVADGMQQNGPRSRAEADALVARWAEYGVVTEVDGFEEPDKTHVRSLLSNLTATA